MPSFQTDFLFTGPAAAGHAEPAGPPSGCRELVLIINCHIGNSGLDGCITAVVDDQLAACHLTVQFIILLLCEGGELRGLHRQAYAVLSSAQCGLFAGISVCELPAVALGVCQTYDDRVGRPGLQLRRSCRWSRRTRRRLPCRRNTSCPSWP